MTEREIQLFVIACQESCKAHKANESGWATIAIIDEVAKQVHWVVNYKELNIAWEACRKIY